MHGDCNREGAIMFRFLATSLIVVLSSTSAAQAQSSGGDRSRTRALWTVSGAGAGFGVGLWAGLTAFDDAVNSDRKVWTSAVVGASIGAVGGYLIGRARDSRDRAPSATSVAPTARTERLNRRLLEHVARSITLSKRVALSSGNEIRSVEGQ
jgi:hypothetical protein